MKYTKLKRWIRCRCSNQASAVAFSSCYVSCNQCSWHADWAYVLYICNALDARSYYPDPDRFLVNTHTTSIYVCRYLYENSLVMSHCISFDLSKITAQNGIIRHMKRVENPSPMYVWVISKALVRVEKYVSRQWHSHADLVTQGILLRASDGDGHAVSSLKSRHHHPSGEHPSFPKIDSYK